MIGYNTIALPIAAGAFAAVGRVLRPEIAALSMPGSSVIVAVKDVLLKRLRLPDGASHSSFDTHDTAHRRE